MSMALAPAVEEPPPAEAGPGMCGRNNPGAARTRFACASPAAIGAACNVVLSWIALIGGILLATVVGSIVLYRHRVPPHRRGLPTALRTEICWAVIPVLMLIGVATAALANL
ncbi:MAG: hypothetical protein RQ847_05730 [Wenzhouxiangellaceae bacterium]|nr:hypothetical protein [Wenzhouxiangellaceae bacterium]